MCLPTQSPRRWLPLVTATVRHVSIPNTCHLLVLPNTGRHRLTNRHPAIRNTGRRLLTGGHLSLPNTVRLLVILNTDRLLTLKVR